MVDSVLEPVSGVELLFCLLYFFHNATMQLKYETNALDDPSSGLEDE